MANVHDVAKYILSKTGTVTAMKLQKLAYYCQAWHLVWEERALFDDEIQAWANGPVVYTLYDRHRGQYSVSEWGGDTSRLEVDEITTIDAVLGFYGDKTSQWLSDLTHREEPWRDARRRAGAGPGERCDAVITHAAMMEYYSGLLSDG